jgi:hypothetical protein
MIGPKPFLQALNQAQVDYLLIGGYAVNYHGYTRPILDLDVWIPLEAWNAQKMVAALQTFGTIDAEEAVRFFQLPERVIRLGAAPLYVREYDPTSRFIHLGTQPYDVEVMTSISGVVFTECYARRVVDTIEGLRLPIIGLADLIANKKASIRPKDADDYSHLTSLI